MDDLAEEMVELVLSHLPLQVMLIFKEIKLPFRLQVLKIMSLQELLTSCCLVCSSWARIIQQPR